MPQQGKTDKLGSKKKLVGKLGAPIFAFFYRQKGYYYCGSKSSINSRATFNEIRKKWEPLMMKKIKEMKQLSVFNSVLIVLVYLELNTFFHSNFYYFALRVDKVLLL